MTFWSMHILGLYRQLVFTLLTLTLEEELIVILNLDAIFLHIDHTN